MKGWSDMPKDRRDPRTPFQENPEGAKTIESAKVAISAILRMSILKQHKCELLKAMLWKITMAHGGKDKIRYRSEAVWNGREENLKKYHEHVWTLQWLTDQLIDKPSQQDDILENAIACMVTKEEHIRLHRDGKKHIGWERYKMARIQVYDAKTGTLCPITPKQLEDRC